MPIVGPLVNISNLGKVKISLKNLENANRVLFQSDTQGKSNEKKIEILNKQIDYAKCGIVSNLLTIATAITLIALGVLSAPAGIFLALVSSLLTLGNYGILSGTKKDLLKQVLSTPFDKECAKMRERGEELLETNPSVYLARRRSS